ncbi:MAG: hypothetical protein ABFD62_00550 [Syntrophaceae bacterium]
MSLTAILIIIALIVFAFALGFVTGAAVYRNNQKTVETLKNKANAEIESIKDKAEGVAEVLKK